MAVSLKEIESKIAEAAHNIIADAEAHEPAIESAFAAAIEAAGAPAPLVQAFEALLREVRSHFETQHAEPAERPADG